MKRIIDISLPVYSGFPIHPPHAPTLFEVVLAPGMPGSRSKTVHKFNGLLHTGTHIDSALELRPEGLPIDKLGLEPFIGPAVLADMTAKVPAGEIDAVDLERAVGEQVQPGDRLLIFTGWTVNYGKPRYFEDSPYLSVAAATWCVERRLALVGVDFQPVQRHDPGSQPKRVLAEHEIPVLSNLYNLAQIQQSRVTLIALPLLLEGMEAAMTRAVVIEG